MPYQPTAQRAAARSSGEELGVEVWGGVEISVSDRGGDREMHVLGLGIDSQEPQLCEALDQLRMRRDARGEGIVERLREHGIDVAWSRVRELAGEGVVGRPHVARALVEIGAVRDEDEAFARWLDHVEGRTRLINDPSLVRWNLDKRYLEDLATQGVRAVPTHVIEQGSDETLPALLDRIGWEEAVLKPVEDEGAADAPWLAGVVTTRSSLHVPIIAI